MIRVDRRLLAWTVSVGLVCLAVVIGVRAVWPFMSLSSGSGGLGAVSVGFPEVIAVPFVIGNIALSVIVRRRRGRPASFGSFCLWMFGVLLVVTLALSLAPPALIESTNSVLFFVLLLVIAIGGSLPIQMLILAVLAFVLIRRPPKLA